MKAAKLLFSILLFPILSQAQLIDDLITYDQKLIAKFYASTTYIVLDQHKESSYSLALQKAVEEYWTITPYEIIDRATFNTYQKDKTKSFLTREHIAGDENLISMSLFMGGQKNMETKGLILANVKLKHYTATDDYFLYKIPTYVQNIQWQVKIIKNQKIEDFSGFQDFLEKQKPTLHANKLYILKEHMTSKVKSLEDVQKYYKHNVSIVSEDVILDAIITQDSTVNFLSIVAPTKNWGGQTAYYRIFSAKAGETLLSFDRSVSNAAPVGVIGSDLKKMNK